MSNNSTLARGGSVVLSSGTIQPSPKLLELARMYVEIVDSGNSARQGAERTAAHEALMDAMLEERIPFNARWEARWIARWLLSKPSITNGKKTTIMFAKKPARYEPSDYDPVRDGVLELTLSPYSSETDERAHAQDYIPVLVTVEPLRDYDGATYERNT